MVERATTSDEGRDVQLNLADVELHRGYQGREPWDAERDMPPAPRAGVPKRYPPPGRQRRPALGPGALEEPRA